MYWNIKWEKYPIEYTAGLQEYCTIDHSQYYKHTEVLKACIWRYPLFISSATPYQQLDCDQTTMFNESDGFLL